jgi:protein phosphatase
MGFPEVRAGAYSAQGLRSNNEDRYLADTSRDVFLVADGMGGQEFGEQASSLAVEIIPRAVQVHLDEHGDPHQAVMQALFDANRAILAASQHQDVGRRMGTTAVLAVRQEGQFYVAGFGDSRAYLIRGDYVEQLTIDHTVADALARNGALTPEQARQSPYRHVLYKFLGCDDLSDSIEVRPFTPQKGDRLVLASDGLTNFIAPDDLIAGAARHADPQEWANELVSLALERGSNDNVTCVVVAFM